MLIFWLTDEEDHFFFPFMYLKFWLLANLRIQYTSRFLLCFIVFYFIFCPARIISYRKEDIVEANIPGEIFPFFFFFLHHLPTTGSALGFSSMKRKEKKKGQKKLSMGKMQHLMLEIFLLSLLRGRRPQPRTGLNANTACTLCVSVP